MIREAAEKLRYQPNHLARNFRNKRTRTIGLAFEDFQRIGDTTGYFSQLLNGVMSATFAADYSLTICPKLIKDSLQGIVFDGRFDGVLWCVPDMSEATRTAIENSPVPIVVVHYPGDSLNVPTFCCDNAQGLRLGVEHLKMLGHTRIAFAVDYCSRRSVEADCRISCFINAMRDVGLDVGDGDVLLWDHDGADLENHLKNGPGHSAIICFSESHAVSLLRTAQRIGLSVPKDLSIIGFDSTAFCETTVPRLTAISQPVEQMAHDAAKHLLACIEGDVRAASYNFYPCGLDIRESTSRHSLSPLR
jgi:LacI family transcriptional regulator